MSMNINTKPVSYNDVLTCWHSYTYRWQDFITQCPDLLYISWFYDGNGVSDQMAVEMRRLVSVWTMLFGSDIVRIILSVADYDIARACRQQIFQKDLDPTFNYCITGFVSLLEALVMQKKGCDDDRLQRLEEMMVPLNLDAFNKAWAIVRP